MSNGPYIPQPWNASDPVVVTSAMQAAVEANTYDVLKLNDTDFGSTSLISAGGDLYYGGDALAFFSGVQDYAQPIDADLTAIAALTGTGYLQRTGVNTWTLGAGGSGGTWGSITGTLSSQTDLQTALNGKLASSVTKAELNTAVSDGDVVFVIHSVNGAASAPPLSLTGTWFAGGTTTTTKPQFLVEPSGTTSTGWSAGGTAIGANAPSGFVGNLLDLQVNSASRIKATTQGFYAGLTLGTTHAYIGTETATNSYAGLWCNTTSPGLNNYCVLAVGGTTCVNAQTGNTVNLRINNSDVVVISSTGMAIRGGTTITKVLSATATLDFGSVAANSYADLTVTVTGAAVGDTVSIGVPNGALLADISFFGWVSATNTVTIRCINVSSTTARDPASGTFRATVTQF